MKLFQFIFKRLLPVSKTSQANELEKIRQTQEHLEREMVKLSKEQTEIRKLIQNHSNQTDQTYLGALLSAWFGMCLVLLIDGFEYLFPILQENTCYVLSKPVVLIAIIYFVWRKNK